MLLLLLPSAFLLLPWAGAGRIIGGREVKPHSRPYMAYLQIESGSDTYRCGGFLIQPDAVLSAAHCVHGKGKVNITVTLGAHNIKKKELSQQKFHVGCWVIHPRYLNYRSGNDIMLLKLKKKAKMTKYVKPISLPSHNKTVTPGTKCSVSGWGQTSVTGHRTDVMLEVDLELQREEVCEESFKGYWCQSMICAGDMRGRKSTYNGDSGGPLVCNWKAHGIVSYGYQNKPFPKVFTRVSYFEPWINEQLRKFAIQEASKCT
ncbi:PREDICTED: mast cell protease 1A-like isoform X1 [Lepidothrix coronata]|uniref:Mast cell protease 1A-like isoform X1 n=2 Tax=Lepidothrix coronata TaxID=321398 RepID=A0A6J0J9F5_9PASS|nr:PREDICTED: mast cell protease 1A-like isoform X1 [Lepidothrix coronata]